jgi:hypothetical protein
VDALWGLGDFERARIEALSALRQAPRLAAQPRFAKRLLGSLLPVRALSAIRARRT